MRNETSVVRFSSVKSAAMFAVTHMLVTEDGMNEASSVADARLMLTISLRMDEEGATVRCLSFEAEAGGLLLQVGEHGGPERDDEPLEERGQPRRLDVHADGRRGLSHQRPMTRHKFSVTPLCSPPLRQLTDAQ
jgi:hypothetical protein